MKPLLILLLLTKALFAQGAVEGNSASRPKDPQDQPSSTNSSDDSYVIELRIQSEVAKIKEDQNLIGEIDTASSTLTSLLTGDFKANLDKQQIDSQLGLLGDSLKRWNELEASASIPSVEIFAASQALDYLSEQISRKSSIDYSFSRNYIIYSDRPQNEVQRIVSGQQDANLKGAYFIYDEGIFAAFDELFRQSRKDDRNFRDLPKRDVLPLLERLSGLIKLTTFESIETLAQSQTDRVKDFYKAVEKALAERKVKAEESIKQRERSISGLRRELRETRDATGESNKRVDQYSVFSVPAMVVGIILILVVLIIASTVSRGRDGFIRLMIEQRTLVEILSMGFLILGIIILGTTDKLKSEALGTVIGTIAGYIFGREISSRTGAGSKFSEKESDRHSDLGMRTLSESDSIKLIASSTTLTPDSKETGDNPFRQP